MDKTVVEEVNSENQNNEKNNQWGSWLTSGFDAAKDLAEKVSAMAQDQAHNLVDKASLMTDGYSLDLEEAASRMQSKLIDITGPLYLIIYRIQYNFYKRY